MASSKTGQKQSLARVPVDQARRQALAILAGVGLASIPGLGQAVSAPIDPARFKAGREYLQLDPPQPTQAGNGQVEVLEFFWYGCGHCNELEPHLGAWLKQMPEGTQFRRIPAALNSTWSFHAQLYYSAEVLKVLDALHLAIFEHIHRDRKPLNTLKQAEPLFATAGVDGEALRKTFESFGVQTAVARARQVTEGYGINSVPTLAVDGHYLTSASRTQGYPGLFAVLNHLIDVRKDARRAS